MYDRHLAMAILTFPGSSMIPSCLITTSRYAKLLPVLLDGLREGREREGGREGEREGGREGEREGEKK